MVKACPHLSQLHTHPFHGKRGGSGLATFQMSLRPHIPSPGSHNVKACSHHFEHQSIKMFTGQSIEAALAPEGKPEIEERLTLKTKRCDNENRRVQATPVHTKGAPIPPCRTRARLAIRHARGLNSDSSEE